MFPFTGIIFSALWKKIHTYMHPKTTYWKDSTTFVLPSGSSNCHEGNLARPICTYKKSQQVSQDLSFHVNTMSLLSKTRQEEQSKNALFYPVLNSFIPNATLPTVIDSGKACLENSLGTIKNVIMNQSNSLNQFSISISQFVHALYRFGYF